MAVHITLEINGGQAEVKLLGAYFNVMKASHHLRLRNGAAVPSANFQVTYDLVNSPQEAGCCISHCGTTAKSIFNKNFEELTATGNYSYA